jgi:gamma-glutamyltranspeptidase/glutathione hydrolase
LRIEARVPDDVRRSLENKGHRLRVLDAYGAEGSAQIISFDERGVLLGGSDPRQEGVALGVERY